MNQELSMVEGRQVLRLERHFAHPPEKVWRAITEPAHFFQWYPFATGEMDLRPGGAIRFEDDEGTVYEGSVTAYDPPHVFAFREEDDLLRFELHPDGQGCLMVFTHTFDDPAWAAHTAAGWHRCVDALGVLLDGRTVEPAYDTTALVASYAEKFGLVGGAS